MIVGACLGAAFVVALFLDIPVSTWAHNSGLAQYLKNSQILTRTLRFPGYFLFTVFACLAMLAMAWKAGVRGGPGLWKKPAIVFLAGILSGVNAFLKWGFGRIRPFHGVPAFELHPFKGGIHGQILAEQNLSFPSGDASLAFAMSASLTLVLPRLWPVWWTLGIIVALERIAENAHYPSDTVAGAALGIVVALLARRIVRHFDKNGANP